MQTRSPNVFEIQELVEFLPILSTEGFQPIQQWTTSNNPKGDIDFPFPTYVETVNNFFSIASKDCWCDYYYQPEQAWEMLQTDEILQRASIDQIKSMLTYCVRGERFCDGHWAAMIEKGFIRKLLERLIQLSTSFS